MRVLVDSSRLEIEFRIEMERARKMSKREIDPNLLSSFPFDSYFISGDIIHQLVKFLP